MHTLPWLTANWLNSYIVWINMTNLGHIICNKFYFNWAISHLLIGWEPWLIRVQTIEMARLLGLRWYYETQAVFCMYLALAYCKLTQHMHCIMNCQMLELIWKISFTTTEWFFLLIGRELWSTRFHYGNEMTVALFVFSFSSVQCS